MPPLQLRAFPVAMSLLGASTLLWAGARLVCPEAPCTPLPADLDWLRRMEAQRHPFLDTLAHWLTWGGSLWLLAPATAGIAVWRWRAGHPAEAVFIAASLATAALVSHLFKLLVARPRQDSIVALVTMPADFSYPSAHTMQATGFAVSVLLLAARRLRRPAGIGLLGLTLGYIAGIGWTRMYLQVHYPTDVLFGFAAASLTTIGLWLATRLSGGQHAT